jgi:hypothetical protein|tara:strand:+ start:504 stop:713 length:210 start_codon:yes stop_codon:yes gene_type:complete
MITTTVMIVSNDGHTQLELTRDETLEVLSQNQGAWAFASNQRVQPSQLAEADWGEIGTIRIVPPLVGGL